MAVWGSLDGGAVAEEAGRAITIYVDQAKVVGLPKGAAQIVVGNPFIASVTQLPNLPAIVLTGKAFGSTNMIVLDDRGGIVLDATLNVALPSSAEVVVQRSDRRSTYRCSVNCEPKMQLGDSSEAAQEAAVQITTRNGLAGPGAASPPPAPAPKAGGTL